MRTIIIINKNKKNQIKILLILNLFLVLLSTFIVKIRK